MKAIETQPADKFVPGTEGIWSGLSEELYHSSTLAPAVQRSLITFLLETSPAHAKCMIDGTYKKTVTPAMQIGTLVDRALLEPERFGHGISHWLKPAGLKLTTKDGKAWKEIHPGPDEEGGLPYLAEDTESETEVSLLDIKGMMESVMRHRIARHVVEKSVKQESAFCFHPPTQILRKCRPDMRMTDDNGRVSLFDLKTTFLGGGAALEWSRHAAEMWYFVQDAWYTDVYLDLLGEAPFFVFVVVERKPPYAVCTRQIDVKAKEAGRRMYKEALELLARCRDANDWPAYGEAIEVVRLPSYKIEPRDPTVVGD